MTISPQAADAPRAADATASAAPATHERRTFDDVVCTGCACACDDIVAMVEDNRIVEPRNACQRGRDWFLAANQPVADPFLLDGRPAAYKQAIQRAAELLGQARSPLIYGLSQTTTEAQRAAVALADRASATIDTPTSTLQGPVGMSLHGVGEMTCTLGEVRNRGDLIIFWGCDPATTHPRHFERYSLDAVGMFVPRGRADRTCVVVDTQRTATAERADVFLQIKPGSDFEASWTLRAVIAGLPVDAAWVESLTGVPLERWRGLAERMLAAKFGVISYGAATAANRNQLTVEALLALTRDMNAHTRFVCNALRTGGNLTGAESVLLWQTGFPFGVSFARGYPRYNAREFSAEAMLARGEIDVAVVVAREPASELSDRAL
ncbi:MAG TPA: formylmethanofuran dehydrogenase subunit B, partial [Pirellulales bacterium]|nr:formylmethanofuran dehydrogenase subunit B [Pirellulales bacterium]